jgi:hypothetical protein
VLLDANNLQITLFYLFKFFLSFRVIYNYLVIKRVFKNKMNHIIQLPFTIPSHVQKYTKIPSLLPLSLFPLISLHLQSSLEKDYLSSPLLPFPFRAHSFTDGISWRYRTQILALCKAK